MLALVALCCARPPVLAQEVPELQINSTAYIVLDAESGEIYAQRNAHDQRAMASLTKIFTAIEALERSPLSTEITTTEFDYVPADASSVGFSSGESFTLEELLYGVMLPSGNDAAHAIARTLGKTSDETDDTQAFRQFVAWMNQRIQAMGLVNTHLVNPDGWGVPNHYSSAYDLAAFTRYALQYPKFVELISTREYTTDNGYTLRNNNRTLTLYPDIVGGKTGYDWDAGWCLINVARRGDTTMIAVTMDGIAPDDWYDDNMVLLDYAFEQKAERDEEGEQFTGEVVSYIDPAPTLLAQSVLAAGSATGQQVVFQANPNEGPLASPVAQAGVSPTPATAVLTTTQDTGGAGTSTFQVLAVALVAVLVIGSRFADSWRRHPSGSRWTIAPRQAFASQDANGATTIDSDLSNPQAE